MAQRSITNFFASPKASKPKETVNKSPLKAHNGSPTKTEDAKGKHNLVAKTKKGGRQVIESDDDEEDETPMETSVSNISDSGKEEENKADMNEENSTPEKKEEDANITKSKTAEPFDIPLRKTARKPKRKKSSDESNDKSNTNSKQEKKNEKNNLETKEDNKEECMETEQQDNQVESEEVQTKKKARRSDEKNTTTNEGSSSDDELKKKKENKTKEKKTEEKPEKSEEKSESEEEQSKKKTKKSEEKKTTKKEGSASEDEAKKQKERKEKPQKEKKEKPEKKKKEKVTSPKVKKEAKSDKKPEIKSPVHSFFAPKKRKQEEDSGENETKEKVVKKEPESPSASKAGKESSPMEEDSIGSPEKVVPVKKEEPSKQTIKESNSSEEDSSEAKEEKKEKKEKDKTGADKKPAPRNPFAGFGVKAKKESDEVSSTYNPAKSRYHPIDDACWKRGEKVPYLAFAKTLEAVEAVSGRLKMIEILSNLLRSVIVLTPDDLIYVIYLCLNRLAPAYEGVELGIGETLLMKTIVQTTGRSMAQIKADVQERGDLGLVAEASRSTQKTMFALPKLTVSGVFSKLKEIAMLTGNSVGNKKMDKIKAMFVACKQSEARFLIRSLGGKLRIGLAEQSVLQAIGQASVLTPPEQEYPPKITDGGKGHSAETLKKMIDDASMIIKTTYCECPNFGAILPVLLKHGIEDLPEHCKLTPGIPLKPMLAHPTKGVHQVLQRFENASFTCEYKYDGERAQIHLLENGEVHIYSRNQENNTSKYPDIIARMPNVRHDDIKSAVIDSEAVAWDSVAKQIQPFQVLSTRKRKDADMAEIKVQVCIYAFDLLYLNGKSLVREPLSERRKLLHESFNEIEGEFMMATAITSSNTEDIEVFLDESIKGSCEGLMVKTLDVDATYEIAKRSHNWLKLKKDYLEGCGDTLDLVVIGGYMGSGKRVGKYGGFLLACYDEQNEEFQCICKIGTGFKDEDLDRHNTFFKENLISSQRSYYRCEATSLKPDHWFDAVQVWEVKAADLSISPVHMAAAGLVDPEKGISLRFPRFLRIRDDKKPEEATSASQVADMYRNQQQIQNQAQLKSSKDKDGDDDEFY